MIDEDKEEKGLPEIPLKDEKVNEFFAFMKKREELRLLKATGANPPWSDDSILNMYSFTNVRRHHDKTSIHFIENLYKPNYNKPRHEILLNCGMARYTGSIPFLDRIGWQDFDTFDTNRLCEEGEKFREEGGNPFTTAYVISNGGHKCSKVNYVFNHVLKDLYENAKEICEVVEETRSWKKTCKIMKRLQGFGGKGFMVKETLLDTTYTGFWNFEKVNVPGAELPDYPGGEYCHSFPDDWFGWTPIGPGGCRGIARVMGFDDVNNLPSIKNSQMLKGIMTLYQKQNDIWDIQKYGFLSPTDVQFQLCEFDKYERARLGQGKPKTKYVQKVAQFDL